MRRPRGMTIDQQRTPEGELVWVVRFRWWYLLWVILQSLWKRGMPLWLWPPLIVRALGRWRKHGQQV